MAILMSAANCISGHGPKFAMAILTSAAAVQFNTNVSNVDPSIGAVKTTVPHNKFLNDKRVFMGPAKVDSKATRYSVDGLVIEYRWGEIFRTLSERP
jgi:hypothetical protein